MNIEEVRLKLVQQALELKIPLDQISSKVDPLAKYIVQGLNAETDIAKGIEKKHTSPLLKDLQDRFGGDHVSTVMIEDNGAVSVLVSSSTIAIDVKEFLANLKLPNILLGRKLIVSVAPPKKP